MGGRDKAEVCREFFWAGEPGDVTDDSDEGESGVGPDPGDGGEELCLWVFFVVGTEVCVDGSDFFFYVGEDGEFSGDAGDV